MGGVGRRVEREEGREERREKKNHLQPQHFEVRKVRILELIMDDF